MEQVHIYFKKKRGAFGWECSITSFQKMYEFEESEDVNVKTILTLVLQVREQNNLNKAKYFSNKKKYRYYFEENVKLIRKIMKIVAVVFILFNPNSLQP